MNPPTLLWTNPFTVNAGNTAGLQLLSAPVGLADGRFLVAWTDLTNNVDSEDGSDIIAQFYDAEGNPQGAAFHLNDFGFLDNEDDVSIVALQNGGFVIAYEQNGIDGDTDILVEEFDSTGSLVREFLAASGAAGADQVRNPVVITYPLSDDYTIVFERLSAGDNDIRAVTMDVSTEILSSEFDAGQNGIDSDRAPDAAAFAGGNFVTVYEEQDGPDTSIEFHIRNASGVFQTQGQVADNGLDPHVAVLANGNFVTTWTATFGGIYAEIRDSSGMIIQDNFAVAAQVFNDENSSDIIALPDGGFLITYHDSNDDRLEVARFDASGTLIGTRLIVDTSAGITNPELALLSDGRALLTWEDGTDIQSAIIDPRDSIIAGTAFEDVITSRPDGAIIFGLAGHDEIIGQDGVDFINGGGGNDTIDGGMGIDASFYSGSFFDYGITDNMDGTFTIADTMGSDGNDTVSNVELFTFTEGTVAVNNLLSSHIIGTAGNDNLQGTVAEEAIFGLDGDDIINASNAGDSLLGGAGDDDLVGGAGADVLSGGTNTAVGDTATYSNSNASVQINLGAGTAAGGHAAGDLLFDIENLFGSVFGDSLTGDDGNNTINGFNGDDTIDGGLGDDMLAGGNGDDFFISSAGADTFNGGTGVDCVDYSNSNAGVTVQINNGGTINGGFATGDTLIVENIEGSNFADDLIGNTVANLLSGNNGDDLFNASSGNDTINGGAGDDFILGSRGADTIDGGSNTGVGDTASYSNSDARVVVDLIAGTATGSGHGSGDTLIDIENIFGSVFNDDIFGDNNNNVLEGFNGIDELFGRGGNDTLIGGGGFDFLNGGEGNDTLTGAGGDDRFLYDIANFGMDTITDFTNNRDLLDFRGSGLQFSDLTITVGVTDTVITVTADPTNSITLDGITTLIDANDFIF